MRNNERKSVFRTVYYIDCKKLDWISQIILAEVEKKKKKTKKTPHTKHPRFYVLLVTIIVLCFEL